MNKFRKKILDALTEHALSAEELGDEQAHLIRLNIETKFANRNVRKRLWHHFEVYSCKRDVNAWRRIHEWIGTDAPILFFDLWDETAMFRLTAPEHLATLIGELPLCTFYVTDDSTALVFCHNEWEYMMGCGALPESFLNYATSHIDGPESRKMLWGGTLNEEAGDTGPGNASIEPR